MAAAPRIEIDLGRQSLTLFPPGRAPRCWQVSTALKGAGEQRGSEQTPRGRHVVRARIGAGLPPGAVLVGRRATGEIWTEALHRANPGRDWILTRILWLSGLEPGRNRSGEVDTMRRFIYIHGTPEEATLGRPGSHGCIRMRNADVVELFDQAPVGTEVLIAEGTRR
jgi:L,D-transpeptidase YbiS